MAFVFSGKYAADVEVNARAFYETLSEKDQRRYVAVEAQRMGFGGMEYLAGIFGCSVKTIERGMKELNELPNDPALVCAGFGPLGWEKDPVSVGS